MAGRFTVRRSAAPEPPPPEEVQPTSVGMSFTVVSEPEPIKVQMTSALAVQLAEQLLRAAAKSG